MGHFMESFEELKAPDGEAFDLKALLTFELFEAELFAHARYKAVGAKVGRALFLAGVDSEIGQIGPKGVFRGG